jgi:hypothetical protein
MSFCSDARLYLRRTRDAWCCKKGVMEETEADDKEKSFTLCFGIVSKL